MLKKSGVLIAVLAILAGAAGCGDDGAKAPTADRGSSSSSSDASKEATGTAIPVGWIGSIAGTNSLADSVKSLEQAVDALNDRGGIANHPLDLTVCDDRNDPNLAVECANSFVAKGIVADLGSVTYANAPAVNEIFTNAGMPRVAITPITPQDWVSDNIFTPIPGSVFQWAALTKKLVDSSIEKISIIRQDSPATAGPASIVAKVAESLGAEVVNDISVPVGTTDYAPAVTAAARNGGEVIVPIGGLADSQQIAQVMTQLGSQLSLGAASEHFSAKNLTELASGIAHVYMVGFTPAPSSDASDFPFLAQMIEDMEQSGDPGLKRDTMQTTAGRSWLIVNCFAAVLEAQGVSEEFTRETIMDAFVNAKQVDIGGAVPEWTPSTTRPAPYGRLSNPYIWGMEWNGTSIQTDVEPIDAYALVTSVS